MKLNILSLSVSAILSVSLMSAPAFAEKNKIKNPGNALEKGPFVSLQLLGFNDYHGHLKTDAVGFRVDEGGGEYLSAKLAELREGKEHSITVAAGDLIGGSPAFSGLFHDEPSVESLNVMGLDISGVGNHEFDEGVDELLRMQNGGCHPVDGCYFPYDPYAGADFQWLAANVVSEADAVTTPLPAYSIEMVDGVKVGFIGMTLEATDTLVAAAGIQGWNFLDEAETANNLVPLLKYEGVEAAASIPVPWCGVNNSTCSIPWAKKTSGYRVSIWRIWAFSPTDCQLHSATAPFDDPGPALERGHDT